MHATMYDSSSTFMSPITLTKYRIMLIDLYERPYSPEASKSRALIDRILALSGPDGGVVGGEDGVSTQRPLKDGGREAWDMIRRLRQKAWQKAGLNPQMLWTERDQIQAGVSSPADDPHVDGPLYASQPGSPAHDPKVNDFKKTFYNITRSHNLSNSTSTSPRPSPLRYSQKPQDKPLPSFNTQYNPKSTPSPMPPPTAGSYIPSSSPELASFQNVSPPVQAQPPSASTIPLQQDQQPLSNLAPSTAMPFMDTSPLNPMPLGDSTPPSMVDPNLNFDWDQWDAVFGQHLPVADDLMELDPVAGLDFANLGNASNTNNASSGDMADVYPNSLPPVPSPSDMNFPPSWNGNSASSMENSNGWSGC